jgi:DnaK suppressor protein
MTKVQKEAYRKNLLALRQRLAGDVSQLASEALGKNNADGSSSMPIHMADIGSDTFEQDFALDLLAREEEAMSEIDAALERLADGTYGRCEDCQQPIPKERLDALPFARRCVKCARQYERQS